MLQMSVVKYADHAVGEVSVAGTWTVHKDVSAMVNDIRNTLYFSPPSRASGGGRPSAAPQASGGDSAVRAAQPARSEPAPNHAHVQVPSLPTTYPELDNMR